MKKILYTILALVVITPLITFAGFFDFLKSMPVIFGDGNVYQKDQWTSTTSPSSSITQTVFGKAIRITGLSDGCLGVTSGIVGSSGSACGSGSGGGSSGGTWSTTTSTVTGRLINYSNNTTDIPAIGGTSTSTADYWFDPNTQTSYLSGNVGIGSSSPSSVLSVSGNIFQNGAYTHFGTANSGFRCNTISTSCLELIGDDNTQGGVILQIENKNAGASAFSGLNLLNNEASRGNNASFYSGLFLNGSNYSDPTFGVLNNVPRILQLGNTMGSITIQASSTDLTVPYINLALNNTEIAKFTPTGIGFGTSSPYAALSVVGNSGVVAEKFTATSTTAFSTFGGRVGVGTTSPAQKFEVSDGNIFVSSASGQGRGIVLSTDIMDDSSRPSLKFLRNNFAGFLGDDHANQTFNFMTALSGTRVFNSTIRAYGAETAGFSKYAGLTHDGTVGSVLTGAGDLTLSPSTLKVGIGTSSPATELNIAGTLPELTLTDTDATTNLKHWFIESDSGAFAIGTTSDQLVKTTTRPFNISSNGQITIGNKDSTTSRLVVTGGAVGTGLVTLSRPGVAQFSFALGGGGLSVVDDTSVFNVLNMFGDTQQNQLYIGSRSLSVQDGRSDILSGTSFSSAAGTDVNGHPLEIIAGRGTGAGIPGDMKFSTGVATVSGTTAQSTSTRMVISATTGNVGIGTSSPSIIGTSLSNFVIGSAAAVNAGMILDGSSTGTGLRYGFGSNGVLSAGILRNNNLRTLTFSNSSANASDLVIGSTGNIGIGTTSPFAPLSVATPGGIVTPNISATSTTATSTFAGGLDLMVATVQQKLSLRFSVATSTTWTGTTTKQLGPITTLQTWSSATCYTTSGTLNVRFGDGINSTNMIQASSTPATFAITTNRKFVPGSKLQVSIGTPATSPTEISCTIDYISNI